jgi:hypothetical protein
MSQYYSRYNGNDFIEVSKHTVQLEVFVCTLPVFGFLQVENTLTG